eukprot:TRINITY_DN18206_c0_g1_i1.p1 TRINITY_DN18206_c0_g1~~TRINITY_DN18206_c0_g1_i1.p1  ORF type:complete len:507 (+),score=85.85 TRINITY_DN18206_c0_g1_i1:120-1640(+)
MSNKAAHPHVPSPTDYILYNPLVPRFLPEGDLQYDEKKFIAGSQTNLSVLASHESPATLMVWRNALVAIQAGIVFAFFMASYMTDRWWLAVLLFIPGAAVLLHRIITVLVLVASGFAAHTFKPCYRKAFIFWGWLPCVTMTFCIMAAILGSMLGWYLWTFSLSPYHELSYLQRYVHVDPEIGQGQGYMDSGRVFFSQNAQIDTSHGGCFHGRGKTYCVAPILIDGEMRRTGVGRSPRGGAFDFFAVGIDCCTCPNFDFRCGEWDNPNAKGGLRSIDYAARPFYRLAVDEWRANYGKDVDHPLFFDWVEDPDDVFAKLFEWPVSVGVLASFVSVMFFFTFGLMLGQLFQWLIHNNIASPLDTPPPPKGSEGIWYIFLPNMLFFYEEERRQYLGIPQMPAPYYPASAPRGGHAPKDPPYVEYRPRVEQSEDRHAAMGQPLMQHPRAPAHLPPAGPHAAPGHMVASGVPTMGGMPPPPFPAGMPLPPAPAQYGTFLDRQAVAGYPMNVY